MQSISTAEAAPNQNPSKAIVVPEPHSAKNLRRFGEARLEAHPKVAAWG